MRDFLSILFDDLHLAGADYYFLSGAGSWAISLALPGRAVFHAVSEGSAVLDIGALSYPLRSGDIFLLPSGCRHVLRHGDGDIPSPDDLSDHYQTTRGEYLRVGEGEQSTVIVSAACRFDHDLAQPLLSVLPEGVLLPGENGRLAPWLHIGIQFLVQEIQDCRPGQQSILNRVGDVLFLNCLRSYVEALPDGHSSWLQAIRDPAIATALSAMHQNPAHGWQVTELASLSCMSRSVFATRFQRVMGKPPLTYLTEHRMRLAAWQLKHTGLPVCRIAELVGYASENAFGQAFKRMHGEAPSRYRVTCQRTRHGSDAIA